MERDWEPTREWIERFDSDPEKIYVALETWFIEAMIFRRAISKYLGQKAPHDAKLGETIDVPAHFPGLTDLIVSWCDVRVGSIAVEPLLAFKRQVNTLARPETYVKLSDTSQLFELFPICVDVLRRVEFWVRFNKRVDEEPEPEAEGKWENGAYGLCINKESRFVRRKGFKATVDLRTRPCRWAVFEVLFDAGKEQPSLEVMGEKYPGKWNAGTRTQMYIELKTDDLRPLEMTVENGRLKPKEKLDSTKTI